VNFKAQTLSLGTFNSLLSSVTVPTMANIGSALLELKEYTSFPILEHVILQQIWQVWQ
jgi:hypothetical protein